MNKIFVLLSFMLALLLAGCSSAIKDAQELTLPDRVAETMGDASDRPQALQNAAEVTQLMFGTLLLEGTDFPVTPGQASELLPLWKLYRSLLESDITAIAEIEAVARQIGQMMTPEQITAMNSQELDSEQRGTILEELGIESLGGAGRGEGFTPPDGFNPPEGGFNPGQGRPGSGDGPGGGGAGLDPEALATRQAARAASGGFERGLNLPLVEALIKFLEQRSGFSTGAAQGFIRRSATQIVQDALG